MADLGEQEVEPRPSVAAIQLPPGQPADMLPGAGPSGVPSGGLRKTFGLGPVEMLRGPRSGGSDGLGPQETDAGPGKSTGPMDQGSEAQLGREGARDPRAAERHPGDSLYLGPGSKKMVFGGISRECHSSGVSQGSVGSAPGRIEVRGPATFTSRPHMLARRRR